MKNKINNTVLIGGITLVSALSSQAAVIAFTDMDAREGTVSAGTLGAITEPADQAEITSLTYTVSGLTIDTDGVANDTITVTLGISALGTGSPRIDWDQGTVTPEFDHNDATFNTAGEGISFGIIGVTGSLSSGDALVVNSAKYTEFTFRRWAGAADELVSIDGDGAAYDWGNGAAAGDGTVTPLDDTAFSITHVSGGSWNGNHFDFTVDVDAIPEPSSTALLGLGGLALIMRRRK